MRNTIAKGRFCLACFVQWTPVSIHLICSVLSGRALLVSIGLSAAVIGSLRHYFLRIPKLMLNKLIYIVDVLVRKNYFGARRQCLMGKFLSVAGWERSVVPVFI